MGSGNRTWAVTVLMAGMTFALLILIFGVIPSEFIVWFNKHYNNVNIRRFVRDPIVVLYHVITIGGFLLYAIKYQSWRNNQAKRKAEAATTANAEPESAFGRPVKSAKA